MGTSRNPLKQATTWIAEKATGPFNLDELIGKAGG